MKQHTKKPFKKKQQKPLSKEERFNNMMNKFLRESAENLKSYNSKEYYGKEKQIKRLRNKYRKHEETR